MKQQLRKPELWQDFEDLCKILWGEIWNCPEIKKNGRTGNKQHGVDIYGTPLGENCYYGIQCKGKDEYVHALLTTKEIDQEIENAKQFKPELKKFYFATTSNKDSKIEEYIRLKDIESRKQGLFEIHLFSWEDIASLIDENRRTHDWYVKKINFKTSFAVEVSFAGGKSMIEFEPTLLRNHITYKAESKMPEKPSFIGSYMNSQKSSMSIREDDIARSINPQPIKYYINGTSYNKSACEFYLMIKNIGEQVIEDYKLKFTLHGDIKSIDTTDKKTEFVDLSQKSYNTFINEDTLSGIYKPFNKILVQNDTTNTDKICFRPSENDQTIKLNWELIARDFNTSGELSINVYCTIKEKHSVEAFDFYIPNETRIENYYGE